MMPVAMIWEIGSASFGIAALLLIGGWVVMRIQRDRYHFQLMQAALERGITTMPGILPGWIISLRQGVLTLGLGVGLLVTGMVVSYSVKWIEPAPAMAATTQGLPPAQMPPPPPPPATEQAAQDQSAPPRPPHARDAHDQRTFYDRDRRDQPLPPPPHPELDRWHRVQTQRMTGLLSMCSGGILVLLGCIRIAFAGMEKRYVQGNAPQSRSGA